MAIKYLCHDSSLWSLKTCHVFSFFSQFKKTSWHECRHRTGLTQLISSSFPSTYPTCAFYGQTRTPDYFSGSVWVTLSVWGFYFHHFSFTILSWCGGHEVGTVRCPSKARVSHRHNKRERRSVLWQKQCNAESQSLCAKCPCPSFICFDKDKKLRGFVLPQFKWNLSEVKLFQPPASVEFQLRCFFKLL